VALIDRVKARLPAELLRQLTQKDDRQPATIDDTVLGLAIDDVGADFKVYAGVAYDDADARHVVFAVRGVLLCLRLNQGRTEGAYERFADWQRSLDEHLRLVTGNDRISPKSSSALTPSDEASAGEIVRPYFDERVIDDVVPRQRDSDDIASDIP